MKQFRLEGVLLANNGPEGGLDALCVQEAVGAAGLLGEGAVPQLHPRRQLLRPHAVGHGRQVAQLRPDQGGAADDTGGRGRGVTVALPTRVT